MLLTVGYKLRTLQKLEDEKIDKRVIFSYLAIYPLLQSLPLEFSSRTTVYREQLAHNCMFSIAACSVNKKISGACYCGWVVPNEHTGN